MPQSVPAPSRLAAWCTPARRPLLALGVALLTILASATSLGNGFAFDDESILVANTAVHGIRPVWQYFAETYWPPATEAGLYRPLAIASYAWQWTLGGGAPLVFHVVNVLLAALSSALVLWVGSLLLPIEAALLAAVLFAVHPVHVEAIANGVGQAELVAACAVLVAVGLYLRDRAAGGLSRRTQWGIGLAFAVGLGFKEHVIVLPALLVAAELVLFTDGTRWQRLARQRWLFGVLLALAVGYLAVRTQVVGVAGVPSPNASLIGKTVWQRGWIMLGVFPEYVRLLVWPAHLASDYGVGQVVAIDHPDVAQIPGVLVLLGSVALLVAAWRHDRRAAFALCWVVVAIAPMTNLLLPTGVLVAERTLYLASVGAMFALAAGLVALVPPLRRAGWTTAQMGGVACLLAGLGLLQSSARNVTWRDSETVFNTLVDDAPANWVGYYGRGNLLFAHGHFPEGQRAWRQAIALMPTNADLYLKLALVYRQHHLCRPAIPLFQQATVLRPGAKVPRVHVIQCQLELAEPAAALRTAEQALADGLDKDLFEILRAEAERAVAADTAIARHRSPPTLRARP